MRNEMDEREAMVYEINSGLMCENAGVNTWW